MYYVLRKHASHTRVIKSLAKLSDMIGIMSVDESIVKLALKSGFKDFEDALQYYTAQSNPEIELIVTRNIRDFQNSRTTRNDTRNSPENLSSAGIGL